MCDIGLVGIGMQASGGISSAFGAYNQGVMQQQMFDYQKKIAKNNAIYAQWQAQHAIKQGGEAATDAGMKARANIGSARATMAARGLDMTEGTPLAVLTGMQQIATTDQRRIREGADMEAWAAKVRAQGYSADAALYGARASMVSPLSMGFGSLLSSAGSVAQSWYAYSKEY
jgi:hypothetical protein